MLGKIILENISKEIQKPINQVSPISGGDINDVYLLESGQEKWVIKVNSRQNFPNMFEAEKAGLEELAECSSIKVARPILTGESEEQSYLLLKYISSGPKTALFWQNFGQQLAQLHQTSKPQFGLDHDNYIGSLKQYNKKHDSWSDFYIHQRLEPQLEVAINSGYLKGSLRTFERLYDKMDNLFPQEPSALLHGDLWSGNFLCGENETPWLIDPAVYYGHREMDIGMMHLFGGFDQSLFDVYNNITPLESGWQERIPLTQLYPLLVHVNLFGEGYVGSVKSILNRFA